MFALECCVSPRSSALVRAGSPVFNKKAVSISNEARLSRFPHPATLTSSLSLRTSAPVLSLNSNVLRRASTRTRHNTAVRCASSGTSDGGEMIPSTRRAVVIDRDTPVGKRRITDISVPQPEPDQVLIKVHSASVNALDWFIANIIAKVPPFIRQGPYVPGKDVSGVVVAVGSEVRDFAVGDSVFGMTGIWLGANPAAFTPEKLASGAYAEYTTLKASEASLKPASISHSEAASLPLAGLTVWQALVKEAKLKQGGKVLILGGAGGVGTLAIQIAKKYCKASTVAVTCSASSEELVRSLGADVVIDYNTSKFEEVLKGQNYDVVVDTVGYDSKCSRSAEVLDPQTGMLVDLIGPPAIGYLRRGEDADGPLEYGKELFKYGGQVRYKLVGVESDGPALREMANMMDSGEIKAVIDKVFSGLEGVEQAFQYSENGKAHGKIVIELK